MKELRHRVEIVDGKMRLDRYLCDTFVIFPSRKSAYKAIKKELVTLNGSFTSPNVPVHYGDMICLNLSEESAPVYKREIRVLYDDPCMSVVVKPQGMLVNGNASKTLERALPWNLRQSTIEDALPVPRVVHRLDRPTGGLVVAAKTARAMMHLSRQFEECLVKKMYRAIVSGKIEGSGIIDSIIDNREAVTEYFVIDNIPSLHTNWSTYIELYPRTGRTHQIRKHLSGIGHPVLGDTQYTTSGPLLRSKGLFLWAAGISLVHPVSEWVINVRSDVPGKFITYMERERRRFEVYHV